MSFFSKYLFTNKLINDLWLGAESQITVAARHEEAEPGSVVKVVDYCFRRRRIRLYKGSP